MRSSATTLQQSAFYFSLLQLLRSSSVMINQTIEDFESPVPEHTKQLNYVRSWSTSRWYFDQEWPAVKKNWVIVLSFQAQKTSSLTNGISREVDELESLRDGKSFVGCNHTQWNANPHLLAVQRAIKEGGHCGI